MVLYNIIDKMSKENKKEKTAINSIVLGILAIFFTLMILGGVSAETLNVCQSDDCNYTAIQDAKNNASSGDTINVAAQGEPSVPNGGHGVMFAGGAGTPEDPYEISNCTELQNMKDHLSASYALKQNIDCSGQGFIPIRPIFIGTFDGQNYTITGLRINNNGWGTALFGEADNSIIQNVILANVDIDSTANNVAALVGWAEGTTITNCHASGTVNGNGRVAGLVGTLSNSQLINSSANVMVVASFIREGGLVGYMNSGSTVTNCHADGISVSNGYQQIGGLVGQNDGGTIKNSYSAVNQVTGYIYVGGLVGENEGLITDCYSTGKVTGTGWAAGGLAGYNKGGKIKRSYAASPQVQGVYSVGGFVGYSGDADSAEISDCYSKTATVIGTGSGDEAYVGGFVGWAATAGTIRNCYSDSSVIGNNSLAIGGFAGESDIDITNSYSVGSVSGTAPTSKGGFIGDNFGNAVNCGWWTGAGPANAIGNGGTITYNETDKTVFYSQTHGIYNTAPVWDFYDIWVIKENAYPELLDSFPSINITGPENKTYNNATILVNITASPDATNVWFFNGIDNETYTSPVYRTFSEGSNTLYAYVNDSSGNLNETSVTFSVDTTVPTFTKLENKVVYDNESLSYTAVEAEDSGSGLASLSVNNANFNITKEGLLTNITSLEKGSYTLTISAIDLVGNTATINILLTVLDLTQQYVTNETTILEDNKTEVVLDSGSDCSVKEIIIPSTINSTQEITLNMAALQNGSNVTLCKEITLKRQGTNNYSTFLPTGAIISGNSSWDGTLILFTTITTLTSSEGTVDVAIEMGSSQRLTFSKAVKVVLDEMAGRSALWKDSTGEHTISVCIDANDTSAGSLLSGECYVNSADGKDLIIWTYHFTKFAAYTPTEKTTSSGRTGGGGGGDCVTEWTCSAWSECANGKQTRTCSYPENFCAPSDAKPEESQTCTLNAIPEVKPTDNTNTNESTNTAKGRFSGLTGAVIGGLTSKVSLTFSGIILAIVLLWLLVRYMNKRKKIEESKKKSEESAQSEEQEAPKKKSKKKTKSKK